jgi:hypothetical protein
MPSPKALALLTARDGGAKPVFEELAGGHKVHAIHVWALAEQPEQQPCALGQPVRVCHRDRRHQGQRHGHLSYLASGRHLQQVRDQI